MSETVADIVAEMRNTRFYEQTSATTEHWVRHFADRIEAAVKRMAVPTPEQWTEIARQGSENETLKRALKNLVAACGDVGYKDGGTAACYESEHRLYDAIYNANDILAKEVAK